MPSKRCRRRYRGVEPRDGFRGAFGFDSFGGNVSATTYSTSGPAVGDTRLDARVTLYLVEGETRSYLLGRCGDSLVVIRDFEARTGASSEART